LKNAATNYLNGKEIDKTWTWPSPDSIMGTTFEGKEL